MDNSQDNYQNNTEERRSEVHTIAQTKSPVKIENIKCQSYKQDDDLTLKKISKITALEKIDLSQVVDAIIVFPFKTSERATYRSESRSIPNKLGQAYQFRCKGGILHKQEFVIRDPTSSAKLTLWEKYLGCLEINQT
ncbi:Hypothetical predicted protein [Paramuricea clavata]|uniref:Uncharacterized protein n=1 Tax=Paramuricea clavata TaxID=317549 RepID=A0A6S7KEA5_PARCT|nr:Hypothetical predicted protein [Paramuricea clavata]